MNERALHIGIDGRELLGKPTGVGRYLQGLLRAWDADAAMPHRLTLFLPAPLETDVESVKNDLVDRFSKKTTYEVVFSARPGSFSAAGTWWEQTALRQLASDADVNVFFAPGYTAPLRLRCPLVVAIHDVSFFAHREWFTWREGLRRRWLTRAAARKAGAILTISEFSAQEIVRWLRVPAARVHVIPPGAPALVRPMDPPGRKRIVLYVGSLFTRRRIPELLDAFSLVTRQVPDASLVLVGDNRTHPPIDPVAIASRLGIGARVEWLEYVTDEQLDLLYWSARVFVLLSDYEGFALTPLEAIAHDVPAVLLDTPVAREIYGRGVRLVRPDSAEIADALAQLLLDNQVHARLLAAGRDRLAMYSWSKAAADVLRVIEAAVARR